MMNTKDLLQKTGMLAVLALALASCSEDELINRKGAASNAISFGIASPTHSADSLPSRSVQAEEPPLLLLGEGKRDTLYLHTSITDNIATPPDQEPATRGIPVDETNFKKVYGSFGITAYAGGALFMDEKISHESGGIWSPDETRYWPADKDLTLDFYAQAPYDNAHVTDVSAGGGEISFSYTVPGGTGNTDADAEAQPDILFAYAACSKAESKGGTVSLKFRHALAGVKFVASNVTGSTIKTITLKGLQGEGTCTYDAGTGTFDWQTSGDERVFSQTFNVELSGQQTGEQPITDQRPETTFMMIPQTLEGVTVEVTLVETASGESFMLTGSLAKTGAWEAGKIYTYAISTESINWEYVFNVTPSITLPLGTTTGQYTVTSYRQRKGDPSIKQAVAWKAENTSFSETDPEKGEVETTLKDILSDFIYQDENPSETKSYPIEVTTTTLRTTHPGDQTLKENTQRGSADSPYDLSTHDENGGTIDQTTANCYVVSAAGTYQLPLVYGNAIKNGSENSAAYQGGNFNDYLDRTISSSSITDADNAVLVWSDGFFMFKDIHLDATKKNLVFTIDSNYMQQANAVLAVRDASNRIMWSWHIWVTERPVYTERHILQDYFDDSNTYVLMQCNLGWVDGKTVYYNQRDLTFRFTQAGSGETAELKVTQEGAKFDYKDVGSTYYQWGRKDPLVALKNWDSYRYEDYRLHETGDPDYVYRYETGPTSIGEAIQHPNVFYTRGTDGSADWNNEHITTLWNARDNGGTLESTTSVKTIYDPSPRGFKVPIPRAFAIWVNGHDGDESTKGELNGYIYEDDVHNKYRVYPNKANEVGKEIPLTATGQRADKSGLPVYDEYGPLKSEVGGLWSLYGVYYWTCVPKSTTAANTLVIRKDHLSELEVYSYGFAGTKTMARPVRPIADR
ncbi:fimbrillin family protein [Bacteroides gallinaceum]|uniref:fimbrillin family protein n=1 Tax=Bacteroides gallinaceum TaxID=1462571 RepID=UPI0025AB1FC1|nr:fimbrillin family protein [Bacteroides gallinaceum]MDN0079306.1 fimbrillin family protein [Bacteroides gallinaceum]